jgi:hypothetical protein
VHLGVYVVCHASNAVAAAAAAAAAALLLKKYTAHTERLQRHYSTLRMRGNNTLGRKRRAREHVDDVVFTVAQPQHVAVVAGPRLEERARD